MVPLLPFQKLVDEPETLQRSRRYVRGMAIAEIVLSLLLVPSACVNWGNALAILLILISASIVLFNTNLWGSHDVCCNLVRPYPTCCSKLCSGPRLCCCSRLSTLHFAVTALIMLTNILNILVAIFFTPLYWLAVVGFLTIFACTAASSYYIRKMELDLAPIVLLPPNKMVSLAAEPTNCVVTGTPILLSSPVATNVSIKLEQCA